MNPGFVRCRNERSLGRRLATRCSASCAAASGNAVPRFGTSVHSRAGSFVNRCEGPSEPSFAMAHRVREHSAGIRASLAEHFHVLGENPHLSRTEANVIEPCAVLTIDMRTPLERLEATDDSGPRARRFFSRRAQLPVTEFMHVEVHQVGP